MGGARVVFINCLFFGSFFFFFSVFLFFIVVFFTLFFRGRLVFSSGQESWVIPTFVSSNFPSQKGGITHFGHRII